MKDELLAAANTIRNAVARAAIPQRGAPEGHDSPGGDAQFDIDLIAETAIWDYLNASDLKVAVYTEDGALRHTSDNPTHILVIDPIDGTRPAAAGLDSSMVSLAAAPYSPDATIADISDAVLLELTTGRWLHTDGQTLTSNGYSHPIPSLTQVTDLTRMFWSIEFNGHPMQLMANAYSDIVDDSANTGGVFIFNSATFSISRIVTGQLDAYVDIGNRVMRDHPDTREAFKRSGRGNILHLFPYDIAAAVPIARAAGVIITDAYGKPFDDMSLTDISAENQRSCIAASTPELHQLLLDTINW